MKSSLLLLLIAFIVNVYAAPTLWKSGGDYYLVGGPRGYYSGYNYGNNYGVHAYGKGYYGYSEDPTLIGGFGWGGYDNYGPGYGAYGGHSYGSGHGHGHDGHAHTHGHGHPHSHGHGHEHHHGNGHGHYSNY